MLIISFKIIKVKLSMDDDKCICQLANYLLTSPLLFNIFQKQFNDSNSCLIIYLKNNLIELDLIKKLFDYLSDINRLSEFINDKDINYLIFFLANLCSLAKLQTDSLRTIGKSLIVNRFEFLFN